MATPHRPKLSATLIWFALIMFAMAVLIVSLPIRGYLRSFESSVQTEIAERAGRALRLTISRAVGREWDSLNAVANQVDPELYDGMRRFTDAVPRASEAVAWAGIVSPGGIVLAGSNGVREGEDVGSRRWFREGLEGGSVGNVYLPTRQSVTDESAGLLNMSTPVLDSFGNTTGVAIYTLRIAWLSEFIKNSAELLEVDVEIVAGDGVHIVAHTPFMNAPMPKNITDLTGTGQALTRIITDEIGERTIIAVQPNLLVGDLPFIDWVLILRVPARTGNNSLSKFLTVVSNSLGILFVIVGLMSWYFANHFLNPIAKLARDAKAIADGEDIYPTGDASSRESAALSDALARMQSQLRSKSR